MTHSQINLGVKVRDKNKRITKIITNSNQIPLSFMVQV